MLHGELAVPCNLQTAPAGWNARQRVWSRIVVYFKSDDAFCFAQWKIIKLRQVWKEAAVDKPFYVPQNF